MCAGRPGRRLRPLSVALVAFGPVQPTTDQHVLGSKGSFSLQSLYMSVSCLWPVARNASLLSTMLPTQWACTCTVGVTARCIANGWEHAKLATIAHNVDNHCTANDTKTVQTTVQTNTAVQPLSGTQLLRRAKHSLPHLYPLTHLQPTSYSAG